MLIFSLLLGVFVGTFSGATIVSNNIATKVKLIMVGVALVSAVAIFEVAQRINF